MLVVSHSGRDSGPERAAARGLARGAEPSAGRAHAHRVPERERAGALAAPALPRALRDQLRPAAAGQAPDDPEAQAAQPRDTQPPAAQGAEAPQGSGQVR